MINESDTQEEGQIRKMASDIAAQEIEDLVHPQGAKPIAFEESRQLFESIIKFYYNISLSDLRVINDAKIRPMRDNALTMINCLNAIKVFDIARTANPGSLKTELITNLKGIWEISYSYSATDVALARISSVGFDKEILLLRTTISDLKAQWEKASQDYTRQKTADEDKVKQKVADVDKVLSKKGAEVAKVLEDKSAEIDNVLATARASIILDTTAAQAQQFDTEANECLIESSKWMKITLTVVVLSTLVAWYILIGPVCQLPEYFGGNKPPAQVAGTKLSNVLSSNKVKVQIQQTNLPIEYAKTQTPESTVDNAGSTALIIQGVAARIFIVSLLFSVAVWCARNYFASRHNYTVNRHRRNAMQTFRAFVAATKDTATQDFILRQAAACAFSPQQTGYLKDESLPAPAPSAQIMEMIHPGTK